eukprot:scaffold2141_cov120-Cylindrotheca_fusiformis.AAC.6
METVDSTLLKRLKWFLAVAAAGDVSFRQFESPFMRAGDILLRSEKEKENSASVNSAQFHTVEMD